MGKEITHLDIDRSHRLGNRKLDKSKPRPIIIKFSRYNVRARIFKNKRKLKGKRTSVTESLTKTSMEKLQKARKEHSFWNAWSNDEKILYIDRNDHNMKVFMTNFFKSWVRFRVFYYRINFVSFVSFYFKVSIVYWGTCTLFRVEKNCITPLTLFRMGGKKAPTTSFSPVTSTNVGISLKNFLTFSFNPFDKLV